MLDHPLSITGEPSLSTNLVNISHAVCTIWLGRYPMDPGDSKLTHCRFRGTEVSVEQRDRFLAEVVK
jgi:hypothetical protein